MTQIHYTNNVVEVYYNSERIAFHKRNKAKGIYNTNKEHLSSTHRHYSEWSPDSFIRKASLHGEHVEFFVKGLFAQNQYPEPMYKRAMGIIQLGKTYGSERLNNACKIASYGNTYSYQRVKNILEKRIDTEDFDFSQINNSKTHIPKHKNTRGASAYY